MYCCICEEETVAFVDEKTNIKYYHCTSCECIFKSPECHQDFSQQKRRYDLHTNDRSDKGYVAYFQRFLDFVLPRIAKPKLALDFGCGKSSILASMLQQEGIACDYYDPIYHSDQVLNKKYHLIVSTEVFEHLHQPREVFGDLVGRLQKGGYLAIQTQFHANSQEDFKLWYYHGDPTHIVFFRPRTFGILAELYGCDVIGHNDKNMIILQKR